MRKKTAYFVAAIAVVVICVIALQVLRRRGSDTAANYETVLVRRDTIVATVNASGSVMAEEQLSVNFLSGGLLAEVNVQVGQKVEAGQQLARLDTRQLELSVAQAEATLRTSEARLGQTRAGPELGEIAAAEASVESAQALYQAAKNRLGLRDEQLSIAEADLEKAELALRDAQAAYDRVAWLPQIGMLPQAATLERATIDYRRALANYQLQVAAVDDTSFKSAAAQLAQAKAQLEKLQRTPTAEELAIAEAQVEQAKASLEQARLRLADAVLVAAISGTVASIGAQVGEVVGAAMPMFVLADLEHYCVDASIDEVDIGRIQVGQEALITLDAFPDAKLRGRVVRVDPLGRVTQGVVSYAAEIQILSAAVELRPAMTAIADIVVASKEGVLVVPNRAIKREGRGEYYVEVMSGDKVQQRLVTTGLSNDLITEIVSGLSEGEEVVVSAPRRSILEEVSHPPFGF